MVLNHNQWPRAVQSYLATISFVDHQVGRLLQALKNSPYVTNTIVVLWGDHGWHLGEKQHWRKHALWEDTTHVPFTISYLSEIETNQKNYEKLIDAAADEISSFVEKANLEKLS